MIYTFIYYICIMLLLHRHLYNVHHAFLFFYEYAGIYRHHVLVVS